MNKLTRIKQKLRCVDRFCESNAGDVAPTFTVNMTVDEDGDACETAQQIDGQFFTCNYCGEPAEWYEVANETVEKASGDPCLK